MTAFRGRSRPRLWPSGEGRRVTLTDRGIEVPGGVGASFQAETGRGRIASELPLERSRRSRGYLAGTIGDGRGRIALETGSGNISLRRGR